MKKHPILINGFEPIDAANAVGKLRYDKLAEFFLHLRKQMEQQQTNDELAGRNKIADDADWLIESVDDARRDAEELFEKYKKYMKDELD